MNDIAIDYWTLRNAYFAQSSSITKIKQRNQSDKNLIANLQKIISELQTERIVSKKEQNCLKDTLQEKEKIISDLKKSISSQNSTTYRQRRLVSDSKNKLIEMEQKFLKIIKEK